MTRSTWASRRVRLRVEFAAVHPAYRNPVFRVQATGASTSMRAHFLPLRQAAADVRQLLLNADLSAAAAPWMSAAEIVVAGRPVTALRVSCVGELGWELHVASSDLTAVYMASPPRARCAGCPRRA